MPGQPAPIREKRGLAFRPNGSQCSQSSRPVTSLPRGVTWMDRLSPPSAVNSGDAFPRNQAPDNIANPRDVSNSEHGSSSEVASGSVDSGHVAERQRPSQLMHLERSNPEARPSTYGQATSPTWWKEMVDFNWRPRKFVTKFRQELQGYRLGANLEFLPSSQSASTQWQGGSAGGWAAPPMEICGYLARPAKTKIVLKPLKGDFAWKLQYDPQKKDARFLTKKLPISRFLNFQIGLGHDFGRHTTGVRWRVSSIWKNSASRQLQVPLKATFPLCPGVDLRTYFNAEYSLPDLHGSMGTGQPALGLNVGKLTASLERMEAIFTRQS